MGAVICIPIQTIPNRIANLAVDQQSSLCLAPVYQCPLGVAYVYILRSGTRKRNNSRCGASRLPIHGDAFLVGIAQACRAETFALRNGDPLSFWNPPAKRDFRGTHDVY